MGRSVSTPANAVGVFYLDWTTGHEEGIEEFLTINDMEFACRHDRENAETLYWDDEWDYLTLDDFVGNVLQRLFPSVERVDDWIGREDRVVAGNYHALFGVSEYCGLAAFWVVVNPGTTPQEEGIARAWIEKAWPKVEEMYPSRLRKMGTFSNGESVYEREIG